MNLLMAALIAASVTSSSQWSIVVTRTGGVAPDRVATLRQSLVKNLEAQTLCGLGTYLPPTSWRTPLAGRSELNACTGQVCLDNLAKDIGVDRLIALRFNEGVERIHVATSLSDVHTGTLSVLEVTDLAADAADAELQRLARRLCTMAPDAAESTSSAGKTDPGRAKQPMDAPASGQATLALSNSDGRRYGSADHGPSLLQKTREIALPISAGAATSGLILSGVFMSLGAWQSADLRTNPPESRADLQSKIAFGKLMNASAITSASVAAVAVAIGATTWFLAENEPRVSLCVDPATGVHAVIRGEF